MSETADFDVEVVQTFDAPRTEVFRAFTDAARVARWYGPEGFPVDPTSLEVDPRPGGAYRLTMVAEHDPAMRTGMTGRFTDVVPDELIVAVQEWDGVPGQEGPWRNHLRVELTDEGAGTRVVLREGPHPPGTADVGRQAWHMMFAKLARHLRDDGR